MPNELIPFTAPGMPPWAMAAASYLARYSGNPLKTYTTSLRLLFTWCSDHGLDPLAAHRVHLALYTRYLEQERKRIPRSVSHHLTPLFGYYRFAQIAGYMTNAPAALLRRPRVFPRRTAVTPLRGAPEPLRGPFDEARTLALDKDELRRLLDAARACSPIDLALVTLMALLGLRVSEATVALVEDLGTIVRGHPTLQIVGKGGGFEARFARTSTSGGIPLPARSPTSSTPSRMAGRTGRSCCARHAEGSRSDRGPAGPLR